MRTEIQVKRNTEVKSNELRVLFERYHVDTCRCEPTGFWVRYIVFQAMNFVLDDTIVNMSQAIETREQFLQRWFIGIKDIQNVYTKQKA